MGEAVVSERPGRLDGQPLSLVGCVYPGRLAEVMTSCPARPNSQP